MALVNVHVRTPAEPRTCRATLFPCPTLCTVCMYVCVCVRECVCTAVYSRWSTVTSPTPRRPVSADVPTEVAFPIQNFLSCLWCLSCPCSATPHLILARHRPWAHPESPPEKSPWCRGKRR